MLIQIFLLLCALFAFWKIKDNQKYAGYPPGPMRLPLLGNILQIVLQFTAYPPLAFKKLADKYGDVMFLKMGMMDAVIISSHEAAVEVMNSDAALNRHMSVHIMDRNMNGHYGISLSNGEVWDQNRRLAIRTLRDFGFGKSASMDEAMNEEVNKFEKQFRAQVKKENGVIRIENTFAMPVINVLWRLLTGKSNELDDKHITKLLDLSHEYLRNTHFLDITVAYPALRNWFPEWTGRNVQIKSIENLKDFFKILIQEHKNSEVYLTNPECFVDVLLEKMEKEAGTGSYFTLDQFVYVLLDLFQASSDTASNTLAFSVLHMIRNPQIQAKVRAEINSVVPPDSPVLTEMKSRLPYTYATILETLRYSTSISFSIPREASRDINVCGHKIPKGTMMTINFEAVNFQKSIWGDPEVFKPEHFLTRDGSRIDPEMVNCLVSFGGGRRVCLGQSLAETALLIYFVNLMRHFEFNVVASQEVPTAQPEMGIAIYPKPFDVCVTELMK